MKQFTVLTLIAVFMILILSGCGGDGATNISPSTADTGTGSLELKVDWDEIDALVSSLNNNTMTGQIIPSTTHHIKITLYTPATPSLVGDPNTPVNYPAAILPSYPNPNGISTINPVTIARPESSITINNIPCGRLMMRFEAQDSSNKNLATRIRFITILVSQTVPVTANLGVTIENGKFDPNQIVVSEGDTLTFGNYNFLYDYYITFTINGVAESLYVPPMHNGAPAMGKFVSYVIPSTTETQVPVYLRTGSEQGSIIDTGKITILSGSGGYVFDHKWGSLCALDSNRHIAVDSTGNVYLADSGNCRIQKYSSSGTFITQWGTYGFENGQFYSPKGVAVDSSNNVYVADTYNGRIQKFDSSGKYLTKLVGTNGQFFWPEGVGVDSLNNVYVADTNNNRIQKFNSNGTYLTQWGTQGSGNGQFTNPRGVAVDSLNNVYVADTNNRRIQKFDSSGTYLTKWGTFGSDNGQFSYPYGVALDSSNNVYVADTNNNCIQKFDSNGTYLTQWGTYGSGNGQFSDLYGIAVDSSNNVYLSESGNYRIQKFDSTGTYITQWHTRGNGNGQFHSPYGVAVDSSNNVYVADGNNQRVEKFDSSGTYLTQLENYYYG